MKYTTLITLVPFFVLCNYARAQNVRAPYIYAFNMESKSINNLAILLTEEKQKEPMKSKEIVFHFKGTLEICFIRKEQQGKLYCAKILPTIFSINEGDNTATYQPDTSLLSQPFYFLIDNGTVRKLFLLKKTPEPVTNTIKSLFSLMQYSVPRDTVTGWTIMQDDPNGHCVTRYSLISKTNFTDSILKVKTEYIAFKNETNSSRLKTTYLPYGSAAIRLDKKTFLPISINSNEKIVTKLTYKTIGVLETTFQLQRMGSKQLQSINTQLDTKGFNLNTLLYSTVPIYTFVNSQQFNILVRRNLLGNDNAETILAKLTRPFREEDADSLYLKIRSLATVYPETAKRLAAILDTLRENTTSYKVVSRGLLEAENKESVNALALLIWKHRNNWNYSKAIISHLGLSLVITDTLTYLYKKLARLDKMSPISKTAQMALGTMVDNLSMRDSLSSARLWKWLAKETAKMGSDQKSTKQKLFIWGNTNRRPALDSVIPYLHSNDEEIRRVATLTTGQFSFSEKVPLLLEVLRTDTLQSIKQIATEGITAMISKKDEIEKVMLLLQFEKDSSIKKSLVNSLNPATKEKIMLRSLLQKIIQQDDCITVKSNAFELLKRMDEVEMQQND